MKDKNKHKQLEAYKNYKLSAATILQCFELFTWKLELVNMYKKNSKRGDFQITW